MFAWLKKRREARAYRKEKVKRRTASSPDEALRQGQDSTWSGMATDARRNHPGFGSAPYGAGRR